MQLWAPLSAAEFRLESRDRDMFLARPASAELHDAWRAAPWQLPWLFSVRCRADALILNSDRSADIVLARTMG
ncbi:hypothetical protein SAMN04488498_10735 [Mesorhizobium albiziae]|uniref:Uncharacterized protein n=1 Tax=Neomesorhizobium albiziae TaxID=335020 RepID=A0A1I3ZY71_9HYPH|nr:hypothetical protein [Mesorhizobium albiziae]GLS33929.1 hypothetical protein GCM10007937_56420 [Mesorhizobium albiziae]SFK49003.1 hypothetical protein SAMN04488498_10735 [Mesorhizobium albiziae]